MAVRQLRCLLLLLAGFITGTTGRPVYGTRSGYDTGGTDPICWKSQFAAIASGGDVEPNNIESLNNELVATSDALDDAEDNGNGNSNNNNNEQNIKLLRSCDPGTEFEVVPVGLAADRKIVTGEANEFRIRLRMNLTAISPTIDIPSLAGESRVFFRLVLCDAIRRGFCDPLDNLQVDELTPSKTDWNADSTADAQITGEDRWAYNQTTDTLLSVVSSSEDSFVFSRWVRWTLRELDPGNEIYETGVNITMIIPTGTPVGAYFFIAHAVANFDLGGNTTGPFERMDLADAIPDNVIQLSDPPKIRFVSDRTTYTLSACIGIFGSIALFFLIFIAVYRNHAIMRFAQWTFLTGLTAACLFCIVFTFTALPKNDLFCALREPMFQLPITLIGCILVGRIWRVYETISTVAAFAKVHPESNKDSSSQGWRTKLDNCFFGTLSFLAGLSSCCSKAKRARRNSLKRTVTPQETFCLIAVLFLPQLIFQIFSAMRYETSLTVQLTSDGRIGREVCEHAGGQWIALTGPCYSLFMNVLAIYIAWIARNLPSAFNEKSQIFLSTILCSGITLVSLTLLEVSDDPTTSPDVEVIVRAFLTIGCSVNILFNLVFPKIQRVMSGEEVVLSHALAGSSKPQSLSDAESEGGTRRSAQYLAGDPIQLKRDDAMPREIEIHTMTVQSMLQSIVDQNSQGRPLTAAQWQKLHVDVARYKGDLDRINYEALSLEEAGVSASAEATATF